MLCPVMSKDQGLNKIGQRSPVKSFGPINDWPAMHPVQWFQENPYIYRHVVLTHGSRALLSLYT